MEVLLALAARSGEVCPKKELIDAVWGEAFVSDEVLTHAVWDLRRAFGDNASDPEFIQTIPKKGYRLIAPVKPMGPPRRRATDRVQGAADEAARPRLGGLRRNTWILGLVAIAALLWVFVGLIGDEREQIGAPGPQAGQVLLLTVGYADGPKDWGRLLETRLGRELAGTDLEVLPAESCDRAVELDVAWCLEARLLKPTTGYEAAVRLLESPGGGLAYSASSAIDDTGENLETAAAELGDKVRTFFEVIEDPFFRDPDIRPWLSLQEHDIRAIRDFLHGLAYTYRNEIGGAAAMTTAMEIEPEFVAPRVFRTPGLLGENDQAALAEHRAALDRLYRGADAFEKAMIEWAKALIDADPAEQIKQLRIALGRAPGNRPIEYVLGITLAGSGALDDAWRHLEPLLGQNWRYPGLYSAAAEIAILRDKIDDIRKALDLALNVEPVDPEVLAVKAALAIYDEDAASEERFRSWLERRRRELTAEHLYDFKVPGVARALAGRAEGEGRSAIADRLRESAD